MKSKIPILFPQNPKKQSALEKEKGFGNKRKSKDKKKVILSATSNSFCGVLLREYKIQSVATQGHSWNPGAFSFEKWSKPVKGLSVGIKFFQHYMRGFMYWEVHKWENPFIIYPFFSHYGEFLYEL